MRSLQPRAWLAGLGKAPRAAPWSQESWVQISSSTAMGGQVEVQLEGAVDGSVDGSGLLQGLVPRFRPASAGTEPGPSPRPVLAQLPAAAELMERAASSSTQPLYDLPTYLSVTHPHASVHPRNPAYDWRRSPRLHERQLLLQVDAHMQQPASREALLRMAQLELAHLWYHQQQQHSLPLTSGSGQSQAQAAPGQKPSAGSERAGTGAAASSSSPPSSAAASKKAAAAAKAASASAGASAAASTSAAAASAAKAEEADDDIFAAADRKAREREASKSRKKEAAAAAEAAPDAQGRSPAPALPAELMIRLRDMQLRAGGGSTRDLPAILRTVALNFAQHVPGRAQQLLSDVGAGGGGGAAAVEELLRAAATSDRYAEPYAKRLTGIAADKAIFTAIKEAAAASSASSPSSSSSPSASSSAPASAPASYWADHPALNYTDNLAAIAHRQGMATRAAAKAGPDGAASLAAAITSLSAALRRPSSSSSSPSSASSSPPATPTLDLLLDYLQAKYADLLHAWEVSAQLREATERVTAAVERSRATLAVQTSGPLSPALAAELERAWQPAAAAFSPAVLQPLMPAPAGGGRGVGSLPAAAAQRTLAAPLDWTKARALLEEKAAAAGGSTAAAVAGAGGDARAAAQQVFGPLLERAAARHRALLYGDDVAAAATAATTPRGGAAAAARSAAAPAPGAAAGVVCFRETLTLDASSAFAGGSHDSRVSLEFSLDRLAASEPALRGAWGARFLERLLSLPPLGDTGRRPTLGAEASMYGRARRGPAARAAAVAAAYPVDVEHSFCRRTRTATLSTARYGSREANRKLLVEHYAELLRAAALAAAGAAV